MINRLKIYEMCKTKGLNMRQASEILDIDYQTFMYWNQGRAIPRIEKFMQLAKYFECKIEDLIDA